MDDAIENHVDCFCCTSKVSELLYPPDCEALHGACESCWKNIGETDPRCPVCRRDVESWMRTHERLKDVKFRSNPISQPGSEDLLSSIGGRPINVNDYLLRFFLYNLLRRLLAYTPPPTSSSLLPTGEFCLLHGSDHLVIRINVQDKSIDELTPEFFMITIFRKLPHDERRRILNDPMIFESLKQTCTEMSNKIRNTTAL